MQRFIKHMMKILQTMINCCDVNKDIVAWDHTNDALQITRATCEKHASNNEGG